MKAKDNRVSAGIQYAIPALVLAAVAVMCVTCSKITSVAANLLVSEADEVAMGAQFVTQIESDTVQYPLYRSRPGMNPALIAYIDSIGQQVVAAQDERKTLTFHFDVIDNDSVINAFAVPGGYIYIYTGLILNARNEDEITGVIAHEVAHVIKRHGVKTLVKQYGYDWVLDLVVGDSTKLRTVVDVATGLRFLSYSRENEYESDSCAVEYSIAAGWNPDGMRSFLQLLADKYAGGINFDWLSTHPDTRKRIEAVQALIDKKPSEIQTRPIRAVRVTP